MKDRSLLYLSIILGAALMLVVVIGGAFAAGMIVAPHFNAQAARNEVTAQPAPPLMPLSAQGMDTITAFEDMFIGIYQNTVPSVVSIRVSRSLNDGSDGFDLSPFLFPDEEEDEDFFNFGQGSGFIWDEDGHIVTNFHVIDGADRVAVIFQDGLSLDADIIGTDPDSDLAVLKIDPVGLSLRPVPLGDSESLLPGQLAIAIGNPFGQESTMTTGIVSAVGRTIRSGNTPYSIPQVVQTDAPINPGNSGGPLLNRNGEVIGINTQILTRNGNNSGIGFAVPVDIAKQVVPVLIEGDAYEYSWLGITGQTMTREVAERMDLDPDTRGALVISVVPDSPASAAGLEGSEDTALEGNLVFGGDVIVSLGDKPVNSMDDLITHLLTDTRPGDTVEMGVIRNGESTTINVTLAARPDPADLN